VAKAFANNAEAVNEALRLLIEMTKVPVGKRQRPAEP
jgi:Arc/MetJ-type ribon-helix-helix transcriptional regulator